jgi:mannitol/fructose-specific phosphotransferase system IIA component (Ntr-type)
MSISIGPAVLDISLAIPELRLRRKDAVLQELVDRVRETAAVSDGDLLLETLLLRERLGSTAIGKGVALPNARSIAVPESRLIVARSRRGIDWRAADGADVELVFLVLSPAEWSVEMHHEQLGRAAAFTRLQRNRQRLLEATDAIAMTAAVREISARAPDDRSAVPR